MAHIPSFVSRSVGHQVFAITASFLLVFRSQLAYQRFWEGRTAIAGMQAKWSDSAAQAVLFSDTDGACVSPGTRPL